MNAVTWYKLIERVTSRLMLPKLISFPLPTFASCGTPQCRICNPAGIRLRTFYSLVRIEWILPIRHALSILLIRSVLVHAPRMTESLCGIMLAAETILTTLSKLLVNSLPSTFLGRTIARVKRADFLAPAAGRFSATFFFLAAFTAIGDIILIGWKSVLITSLPGREIGSQY